jgi:uncharacterized protein
MIKYSFKNIKMARSLLLLLFWVSCSMLLGQSFSIDQVPNPKSQAGKHYLSDPKGILKLETVQQLDSILAQLEDSTTVQVGVVMLPSIGEEVPKDFAHNLFNKWGLGVKGKDNGLLVLFVLDQKRIEFETGDGLEGVLPDALCKRIQMKTMIPAFQDLDYDLGMQQGTIATAAILQDPDNIEEVFARAGEVYGVGSLDGGELMASAFVFSILLFFLRALRYIFRTFNATKARLDQWVSSQKGYGFRGGFLYILLPFCLPLLAVFFRDSVEIHVKTALLMGYLYLIFIFLEFRFRRQKAFQAVYGQYAMPNQYLHQQQNLKFNWVTGIFLPIPFLFLYFWDLWKNHQLRYGPRKSKNGNDLSLVSGDEKNKYLTANQKVEADLDTVDYDIWRNEQHNETTIIRYKSLKDRGYVKCPSCNSIACKMEREEELKAASESEEGEANQYFTCQACDHSYENLRKIPIINSSSSSTSSGGGSSSGGSSSSSSSSSSWGGGGSSGGGSGSSW